MKGEEPRPGSEHPANPSVGPMHPVHLLGRLREHRRLLGAASTLRWSLEEVRRRGAKLLLTPLWRLRARRAPDVLLRLPGRDPQALRRALTDAMGEAPRPYRVDVDAYRSYLAKAAYPRGTYGDETDPAAPFHEKTLEHFVAFDLLDLGPDDVFLDVASNLSRVPEIAQRLYGCRSYRQDLVYPEGVHGELVGSTASDIPLPDESLSAITLHCSFEHFEGEEDTAFLREAARLLRPGGRVVILPLYLALEHTLVTRHLFGGPPLEEEGVRHRLRVYHRESRFSRFYAPGELVRRVVKADPRLKATVHYVENHDVASPSCYLKFALVLERRAGT